MSGVGNLKFAENKEIQKEQKPTEPTSCLSSSGPSQYPEKRLFDEPFRIKFLMAQSEKNPFNL